jgi:hypothetical protein
MPSIEINLSGWTFAEYEVYAGEGFGKLSLAEQLDLLDKVIVGGARALTLDRRAEMHQAIAAAISGKNEATKN